MHHGQNRAAKKRKLVKKPSVERKYGKLKFLVEIGEYAIYSA